MNRDILIKLRDVLTALYPDEASIRRVIADSGIGLPYIDFTPKPVNNWHSILTEAETRGRVDMLLDVVEREYGRNSPHGINQAFQDACDAYRRASGEPSQPSDDLFSLAISPMQQHSVKQATFTVEMHNGSRGDMTIQLTGTDAQKACLYKFESAQIIVPADQTGSAQLTIFATKPAFWKSKVHRFKVIGQSLGANQYRRETEGEWRQLLSKGQQLVRLTLITLVASLVVNFLTYRLICFNYSLDWYHFYLAQCTEQLGNIHLLAIGAALLVVLIGIVKIVRLWRSIELNE